jgi:signal transduction histidine kinase
MLIIGPEDPLETVVRYRRAVTTRKGDPRSRIGHPPLLDVVLVIILLVVVEATAVTKLEGSSSRWLLVILGVVALVPLAWRRRAPLLVWAVSGCATFAALAVHGSPGPLALGPLIALYTVATISPRPVSLAAGVTTLVGVTIGVALGGPHHLGWQSFVFPAVVVAACWLVGDNLRVRRAYVAELEAKALRADDDRAAASARAVSEERARIARELHDVVVHHVSVIAVQAGAARMRSEHDPGLSDTAQAWAAVESAARQALSELRQLLGVLRHAGEPAALAPSPGLDQLDQLLAEVSRTGLPVSLRVDGDAYRLPPAMDLSAYRIVQEALTNALKHGGARPTTVFIRYGIDDLEIDVTNEGPAPPLVPPASGVGHGLVGMRERVSMFGGTFTAGPRPEGGFEIEARIPVTDRIPLANPDPPSTSHRFTEHRPVPDPGPATTSRS